MYRNCFGKLTAKAPKLTQSNNAIKQKIHYNIHTLKRSEQIRTADNENSNVADGVMEYFYFIYEKNV